MAMKYDIEYLPSAAVDIETIVDVFAEHPQKAARILREMDYNLQMLRMHPNMYPVYSSRRKYRKMVLEDYLLFYTVDETSRKITVCRVLYGRMDIAKKL
jgi:plasmid stabilization system protein ParE